MDPIYLAYMSLRRYDYKTVANQCSSLLKARPDDQYALLMRMQAVIEDSAFDETEFEQSALDKVIDQTNLDHAYSLELSLPTSFRPQSRLTSGYVRPLTAAMGRPGTRTSSRLGSSRLQTARLGSAQKSTHLSRMGTASVKNTSQSLQQGLPEDYGEKPIFRRLLPNYYLRLQPSELTEQADITPNPRLALQYLKYYQQEAGSDWFFNDRAARALYLLKNYEEAERHLNAAIRDVPREETTLKQINCLACRGNVNEALNMLKEASSMYSSSSQFHLQAARLNEILQNGEKALQNYAEVLKMQTGCEEALAGAASLINAGYQAQDKNESLSMYRKLLLTRNQDPSVWNNIGVCLMQDELYGDAFQHFLTALNKCASQKQFVQQRIMSIKSSIIYNMGTLFAKISDLQAAQDCFELATLIDGNNSEAVNNMGVLSYQVEQETKALQLFKRAEEINGNETAKKNKEIIMKNRGNYEGIGTGEE
ncbi:Tetratricopeptide_repeat-containing protein [Hexamita inflata]|uniref:Tetratricopeptide repeat-containing protein n=1 Tax=Hexamita inflata TaxID=28002 RepID=A0AA86UB42_9EUKA|nr:Tetratricopeptide repeat-containing protein [Hexamita inflata]CAI9944322.1 Tetratricopeptide repeat-containing protein [Hexamita inflata]CAI9963644.1 Tetratricopeptide repeat-containing protein [Hexamita inflata]